MQLSTLQAHLPPSIALLYAWPIARECEARRNVDKRFARKEKGKKKSAARYSMEFVKTIGFVKGANLVASDGNHSELPVLVDGNIENISISRLPRVGFINF